MRILIATDAWRPQVNGVVRSLEAMAAAAQELGAEIEFLTPRDFFCVPMPTYPEIELAFASSRAVERRLAQGYDHVHIATEGPVGRAARACCLRLRRRFTTSYHTRFPEYIEARTHIPSAFTYGLLRRFHNASAGVMVSTPGLAQELAARGFRRLRLWSRGVDHELFHPGAAMTLDLPKPIFLYAGRLAIEKNVEAFLSLDLPGTKAAPREGACRRPIQRRISSDSRPPRSLRRFTRAATYSFFQAAPTHSAWCCWRRWPADCRSRPFPSPARATSSGKAAPACCATICVRRLSRRSTCGARPRDPMR
jgi:hypothetical protein